MTFASVHTPTTPTRTEPAATAPVDNSAEIRAKIAAARAVVLSAIYFEYDADELRDELHALEHAVFSETYHGKTIRRLYELKRELVTMRLAVAPLQDITSQLVRLHPNLIREEARLYFRDVFDHAMRINESTDAVREMVTAAMSVNLSVVTLAQGEVVKRLAGWAALLAAPTLIASWYGMNFTHMPELDGRWSYAILIAVTGVVVTVLYRVLKRARWL